MALSPFYYIKLYAPKLGLDWRAVAAYAMEESGGRWGAVGDHGTSFGPFQMHRGGALGSHTPQWAMSPQGILAGMQMMAQTPIRGTSGTQALRNIYTYFGKGSNNAAAYQRALPYLGGGASAPAANMPVGEGSGSPSTTPPSTIAPGAPGSVLGALLQNLYRTEHGGHPNIFPVLAAFQQQRAAEAQQLISQQQATSPSDATPTMPVSSGTSTGGWSYPAMQTGVKSPFGNLSFAGHTDWVHVDTGLLAKMNEIGRALGVKIEVISGYRSPGYSASVGGYANDPHSRGVAVDAYINGRPIGDYSQAVALMKRLGLETGAQPGFYRGKSDPEHVQVPGSGVNKSVHAQRTAAR